jgi:hypothetical protein
MKGGQEFPRKNERRREHGKKERVSQKKERTRVFYAEEEQHTHDIPQPRNAQILPTSINLALLVHSPQRLALIRHFVSADPAYPVVGVGEALFQVIRIRHAPEVDERMRTTHPVQKTTTSAESSLPLSNFSPLSVNPAIWLSFFSLILPSMRYWLPPTSVWVEMLALDHPFQ